MVRSLMKYILKVSRIFFFFCAILCLFSCITVQKESKKDSPSEGVLQIKLNQYKQNEFKQVEATFFTHQSKELVFRVLSNIKQTPQWLSRINRLEVLAVYNNHQYLLRTIINSPWPFKNRELITCVDTFFEENITRISISSCSERVALNDAYLRLLEVESRWTIKKRSNSLVEVNYKTWIDPAGNVPAFIFNNELLDNSRADLKKLQTIIDNASLAQYSY